MKKSVYLSVILVITLVLLAGCGPKHPQAKDVVGKYFVSEVEENDATGEEPKMVVSMEYDESFNSDLTFDLAGVLKMVLVIEDMDYSNMLTFEYGFTAAGTWGIEGEMLSQKVNNNEVSFNLISASATIEDDISLQAMDLLQQSFEAYFPEMANDLNMTAKIERLDTKEMILKPHDERHIKYMRVQ